MWDGVKKMKNHLAQHDLQLVFGGYSQNGMMEMGKLIKLAKDCKGLINDIDVTSGTLEIQFR